MVPREDTANYRRPSVTCLVQSGFVMMCCKNIQILYCLKTSYPQRNAERRPMFRLRSDHNSLLPSAGLRPNKPIDVGMTLKSEAPPSAANADHAPGGDSQHRRASSPPLVSPASSCPVAPPIMDSETSRAGVTSKRLYELSVKIKFYGKTLVFDR